MVYRDSARARARAAGVTVSSSSGVRSTPSLGPIREEPVWQILHLHGEEWYLQKWVGLAARLLNMKKTGYICGALPHLIADVRAARRRRAEKPPDPTVMAIIEHNRVARRMMRTHGGPIPPDLPGNGQNQNGPTIGSGDRETLSITIEQSLTVGVRTPGTRTGATRDRPVEAPPGLHWWLLRIGATRP